MSIFGADMDGTLTNLGESTLNPKVREELPEFVERNGIFIPVTGRIYSHSRTLDPQNWEMFKSLSPIQVVEGGAKIVDNNGDIINHDKKILNEDHLAAIADLMLDFQKNGIEPLLAFQIARFNNKAHKWEHGNSIIWLTNPSQYSSFRRVMYSEAVGGPIHGWVKKFRDFSLSRMVCVVTEGSEKVNMKLVQNKLDDIGLTVVGHPSGFDISLKEFNKATGMREAANILGFDKYDNYAGDGIADEHGNDRPPMNQPSLVDHSFIVTHGQSLPSNWEPKMRYTRVNNASELALQIREM